MYLQLNVLCLFFRNPEILDECDIDEKTKKVLITNIKRRMAPQAVKIRAGLNIWSSRSDVYVLLIYSHTHQVQM